MQYVYGMLLRYGYQPKRAKHEIITSATRMAVTKLAVNTKPGLDQSTRSRIRAIVYNVERHVLHGEPIPFDHGLYAQAMGQVRHLERFHPGKAAPLKKRLLALKNIHKAQPPRTDVK